MLTWVLLPVPPYLKKVLKVLVYMCTKFGAFFIKCTIDLVCRYTIGILYYFPSCLFFLHRVNPITWTGQELLLVPCEQGSMESVAQLYKSNDDEEEEESSAL